MKILSKPRGAGKTTALIQKSAHTGQYIMCSSHQRAYEIAQQAEKLGYNIPFPITPRESLAHCAAKNGILVDDLERLFQQMVGIPVDTATMSSEDVVSEIPRIGILQVDIPDTFKV